MRFMKLQNKTTKKIIEIEWPLTFYGTVGQIVAWGKYNGDRDGTGTFYSILDWKEIEK